MLQDQVRRSKKKAASITTQRLVKSRPQPTHSSTKLGRARSVSRLQRPRENRSNRSRFNVVLMLLIPLLLVATLWYGINRILTYVMLSPTPQMTLLVQASDLTSATLPTVWLLVEGRKSQPQYFLLASRSELTSGMTPALTVTDLVTELIKSASPQTARTVGSQLIGLPIDQVVHINSTENDWQSVVNELRQRALLALQAGSLTDASVRLWFVARISEGNQQPETLASIITYVSRQNLEPITSQENCPVAVLNNSGKAGLATLVGKIIEQSGGTVLRVANALTIGESATLTSPTSTVAVLPGETTNCAGTLAAISKLLSEPTVSENQPLAEQYRSSIVLLLGPDAQLKLPTAVIEDALDLRQ